MQWKLHNFNITPPTKTVTKTEHKCCLWLLHISTFFTPVAFILWNFHVYENSAFFFFLRSEFPNNLNASHWHRSLSEQFTVHNRKAWKKLGDNESNNNKMWQTKRSSRYTKKMYGNRQLSERSVTKHLRSFFKNKLMNGDAFLLRFLWNKLNRVGLLKSPIFARNIALNGPETFFWNLA